MASNDELGTRDVESLQDGDFWAIMRQALLLILDAIERKCGIAPRTAEIRRAYRAGKLTTR